MTALLRIDGLHAGYGKVEVLHGISLVVPKAAWSPSSARTAPARRR